MLSMQQLDQLKLLDRALAQDQPLSAPENELLARFIFASLGDMHLNKMIATERDNLLAVHRFHDKTITTLLNITFLAHRWHEVEPKFAQITTSFDKLKKLKPNEVLADDEKIFLKDFATLRSMAALLPQLKQINLTPLTAPLMDLQEKLQICAQIVHYLDQRSAPALLDYSHEEDVFKQFSNLLKLFIKPDTATPSPNLRLK